MQEDTKSRIIRQIRDLNRSATEEFLARFSESDLQDYLGSLRGARRSSRSNYGQLAEKPRQVVAVG